MVCLCVISCFCINHQFIGGNLIPLLSRHDDCRLDCLMCISNFHFLKYSWDKVKSRVSHNCSSWGQRDPVKASALVLQQHFLINLFSTTLDQSSMFLNMKHMHICHNKSHSETEGFLFNETKEISFAT